MCAQKIVAFVVFCLLIFVLLDGFGLICVFVRQKSFRIKNKQNCPDNLTYNTTDTVKAFVTILLIRRYNDLPRRPIFRENTADVQKKLCYHMSRSIFEE